MGQIESNQGGRNLYIEFKNIQKEEIVKDGIQHKKNPSQQIEQNDHPLSVIHEQAPHEETQQNSHAHIP